MLSPLAIWKKAESFGKSSFIFRFSSHLFAAGLIFLHYHDNGLALNYILILNLFIILGFPFLMLYSYVNNGNDQGLLIKHTTYDFFTTGWLVGVLHLSIVPSVVYVIAIFGNYIGMRGFHKVYRTLLIPLGLIIPFTLGGFKIYLGHSIWMLILSFGYMSVHFIVLATISYHFAKRSNDYNKLLISKNGMIDAQKEEILTQSQRLLELNMHLEELVETRTKELEVKNKKLTEYAFINAHKLRKPVANILGLMNLFKGKGSMDSDSEEIISYMKESTLELDDTVRHIRDKLEEEDLVN